MMRVHIRWRGGAIAALLGLGFLIPGQSIAGKDDPILPQEVYSKLAERAISDIQDSLHELSTSILSLEQYRHAVQQARCAAIMLAMYAQLSPAAIKDVDRATLMNASLALAQSLEDGKIAEAKQKAEALKNLKADPKAEHQAVARM